MAYFFKQCMSNRYYYKTTADDNTFGYDSSPNIYNISLTKTNYDQMNFAISKAQLG